MNATTTIKSKKSEAHFNMHVRTCYNKKIKFQAHTGTHTHTHPHLMATLKKSATTQNTNTYAQVSRTACQPV